MVSGGWIGNARVTRNADRIPDGRCVGYRFYDHLDVRSERFRGEASPGLVPTACAGACINALVFTMRVNAAACELALHTSDTPEEAMRVLSAPQQAIAPRLRMLEADETSLFQPVSVKREAADRETHLT